MTIVNSNGQGRPIDPSIRGYLIIRPDMTWEQHAVESCPTLAEMQEIVGGYIERVRVLAGSVETDMIVDEEGLLKDKPLNHLAMMFYPEIIVGTVTLLLGGLRLG